jgi:hypothetical protein
MVSSKSSFPLHSRPQTPDSPSLPTLSAPSSPQFQPPLSLCRPVSGHGSRNTDHGPRLRHETTSATPLSATLTDNPQLHENKATLSPAFATLTRRVKHKSFICHSYKKHGGVGYTLSAFVRASHRCDVTLANSWILAFLAAHSSLFSLFDGKRKKLISLLSYSSALFKKERCDILFPINSFRTLCQNTGGGGAPPLPLSHPRKQSQVCSVFQP